MGEGTTRIDTGGFIETMSGIEKGIGNARTKEKALRVDSVEGAILTTQGVEVIETGTSGNQVTITDEIIRIIESLQVPADRIGSGLQNQHPRPRILLLALHHLILTILLFHHYLPSLHYQRFPFHLSALHLCCHQYLFKLTQRQRMATNQLL